jgi:hypothetical protein
LSFVVKSLWSAAARRPFCDGVPTRLQKQE